MNGIIVIDKPAGPSSADIVRQMKARFARHTRVGHLGTLDPFATGVLPILIGEGTKLAPFLQEGRREYAGLIRLGSETDTLDSTGRICRTAAVPILDPIQLGQLATRFTGAIEQTPPIFSAIKRHGVPLYKLARRSTQIEPPTPRTVEIERLELAATGSDSIRFTVLCTSGMYVRSLARDLGIALGTAAHVCELRRIRTEEFSIADAHRLNDVLAALDRGETPALISMRAALAGLPEAAVDPVLARRIRRGDSRALDQLGREVSGLFKVILGGELVAVARSTSRMNAVIVRVFAPEKNTGSTSV
jgi:tRNA pseudouridine55 synthase